MAHCADDTFCDKSTMEIIENWTDWQIINSIGYLFYVSILTAWKSNQTPGTHLCHNTHTHGRTVLTYSVTMNGKGFGDASLMRILCETNLWVLLTSAIGSWIVSSQIPVLCDRYRAWSSPDMMYQCRCRQPSDTHWDLLTISEQNLFSNTNKNRIELLTVFVV